MAKKKKKKKVKKKALIKKYKKRVRKTPRIKKFTKISRKKIKINIKKKIIKTKYNRKKNQFLVKFIKFQEDILQKFKFKINFSLDKKIQSFFDAIDEKIQAYKVIRIEEKAKIKLPEFTTLNMTAPLMGTIFAIFFLNEKLNILTYISLLTFQFFLVDLHSLPFVLLMLCFQV